MISRHLENIHYNISYDIVRFMLYSYNLDVKIDNYFFEI